MRARLSLIAGVAGIAAVALSGVAHAAPQVSLAPMPTTGETRRVAIGSDGNLWFTALGVDGIGVLTPGGTATMRAFTGGGTPAAVTSGPDGNVWFSRQSPDAVGRITPAGDVATYALPEYADVRSLAAGPGGNVWFAQRAKPGIGRVTPAGAVTEFPLPNARTATNGIALGAEGNLWFAEDVGDKVGRITPAGVVTEFSLPTPTATYGIAAGADGNIWFTAPYTNHIGRITPAGAVTEFAIPTADAGPGAVAAGPDGNVWFVGESGVMGSITPAGVITEYTLPAQAYRPQSILVANDGTMWVGSMSANLVKVDLQAGAFLRSAAVTGTARVGETLTCAPQVVRWAGQDPTLAYGWTRDGATVDGATAATYTPAPGDAGAAIACTVNGRYPVLFPGARNSATSAAVTVAAPAPVYGQFAATPKLASGAAALAFAVKATEPGRVVAFVENRAGKRIPLAPSSRLGRRTLTTPMWASALPGSSPTTTLPRTNVNLRFGQGLPKGTTLHLVLQRPDRSIVDLVAPRTVR